MLHFDYMSAAQKFAADTQSWGGIIDTLFYTTDGSGGWKESCDNAHGGLDVSWAFHRSPVQIKLEAPQRFIDMLVEQVEQGVDESFDAEQWMTLLEQFK